MVFIWFAQALKLAKTGFILMRTRQQAHQEDKQ
jgi:hypothetical protein